MADQELTRVFYDEDVPHDALRGETVAVLGYGIQGRAQALTLRDSDVPVVVGNRLDSYHHRAHEDGFHVHDLDEAARRASILLLLVPDEVQPEVFRQAVEPHLERGKALVFAHGFCIRYGLIEPPPGVDVLLLAPRLPGSFLRSRYLEGWGVPAFVGVERDATGKAWSRLLGLAGALGITRCAAIETSFTEETELDHFSEHVTYPLIFRALELAFETMVEAGFPPELALMELHGSGELGEVLQSAAEEGLYDMLEKHASPICQAGMARYWDEALGSEEAVRAHMRRALEEIRSGSFARHVAEARAEGHPELSRWRGERPRSLRDAERTLRRWLRGFDGPRSA